MRLHGYLLNEGRSQRIDTDTFKALAKKHCKKALAAYEKGTILYRGNEKLKLTYGTLDPKGGGERKSAFADGNHYTLLLDNLPSWKRYPKRKESVIMTTDYDNAKNRGWSGGSYVCLPYDGATLAVCPDEDIWISFPHAGLDNWDTGDLNEINRWLDELGIQDNASMISDLKNYTNDDEDNVEDAEYKAPARLRHFESWAEGKKGTSLWDYLNDILDPKKNLFKLMKVGDRIGHTAEVWTDSKCLLLNTEASGILNDI